MKLILVRHGQSQWNLENKFTGWENVALSEYGKTQAYYAGILIKDLGLSFDVVFTSVLKRAIHTAYYIMEACDRDWVPIIKDWHLNERHYGSLQGLNKAETARKYGEKQVHIWRRSFDVRPPSMSLENPNAPIHQDMYQNVLEAEAILCESLKDTMVRTVNFYETNILPHLNNGENVLIVAHGNSLRSLMKHLEGLSDEDVINLELETAVPVVYTLDDKMTITNKQILN